MSTIVAVRGREILDSRGNPTVEVTVELDGGARGTFGVPSGASTGAHEALELRDEDTARYGGKGVLKAVENVNTTLAEAVKGMDAADQEAIDREMIELDGTENKSKLGANAILGVSIAVAKAAAADSGEPLYKYLQKLFKSGMRFKIQNSKFKIPVPLFNVINGGAHADSGLAVQEFKLVPTGIIGYAKQLQAGSEIFHALEKLLAQGGFTTSVGDEGGFASKLESHAAAFEILIQAIGVAGYKPGGDIFLDIDAAVDHFYDKENHRYQLDPEGVSLSREQLIALYREWIGKYPLVSIEDPLHEEDWEGWRIINEKIGDKIMIVGDDLLVTNVKRLEKAIAENACNSVLVKANQIGTLTETFHCVRLAQKEKMKTIISHRSGETCDDFIADLAVAVGADFIKTGSLSRGERLAKYNRLLAIEEELRIEN